LAVGDRSTPAPIHRFNQDFGYYFILTVVFSEVWYGKQKEPDWHSSHWLGVGISITLAQAIWAVLLAGLQR
jgi:hypothetical protein